MGIERDRDPSTKVWLYSELVTSQQAREEIQKNDLVLVGPLLCTYRGEAQDEHFEIPLHFNREEYGGVEVMGLTSVLSQATEYTSIVLARKENLDFHDDELAPIFLLGAIKEQFMFWRAVSKAELKDIMENRDTVTKVCTSKAVGKLKLYKKEVK